MRTSTLMQHKSKIKMMSSENYKKYFKTQDKNTKPTDTKNTAEVKDQTVKLGDNLQVEKKGDQITISQIGKDQKMTTLQQLSANSSQGQLLLRLFKPEDNPSIVDYKKKLLEQKRSSSLSQYL